MENPEGPTVIGQDAIGEVATSDVVPNAQVPPVGSVQFRGLSPAYVYAWPVRASSGSLVMNCAVKGS
jgi:hypothetical protein